MLKPIGWALIVTVVALVLMVGTAPFLGAGNASRVAADNEVVLIRNLSARGERVQEPLSSLRATVLETYPSWHLVSIDRRQREDLTHRGFEVIELKDRTRTGRGAFIFDTRHGEPALPDALRVDPRRNPQYDVYIVQFIGPVKAAWVDSLRAAGAEVLEYLPSFSYIAAMDRGALERVRRLAFVRWTGLYQPAYKISPALLGAPRDPTAVSLGLFQGRSPERAESIIATSGGEVTDRWTVAREPWLRASVTGQIITDLARLSEVAWIEEYAPPSFVNDQATGVVQSGVSGSRTVHAKGLEGQDQLITMTDEGPDLQHPALKDPQNDPVGPEHRKIQACDAVPDCPFVIQACQQYDPPPEGHGTFVAGVVAGDDQTADVYEGHDGHAFRSRLIVQDIGPGAFCVPANLIGNLFTPSLQKGSRIHTNSWGTSGGLPYCVGARESDLFMRDNPDYLTLFAAGNSGIQPGVRCEARAKNVITVGASKNGPLSGDALSNSSRGPADSDGRRKPTVMAPGESVCSAKRLGTFGADCTTAPITPDYSLRSGTSFAAPAVAGNAALVRQYFTEGWYPSGVKNGSPALTPSAALIKGVLVNGAEEMTGAAAWAESTVKTSSIQFHNAAYALRAARTLSSPYAARATSEDIALDYTQPYTLEVWFFVPNNATVGQMLIADDGRAKAHLVPAGGSGVSLKVLGGNGSGQAEITKGQWWRLRISHNPPSGTFQAFLFKPGQNLNLGTFTFLGPHLGKISVGTESAVDANIHGEVFFDDICYLVGTGGPPREELWCDFFGVAGLGGWTVTPNYDESGYPNNIQGWGRIHLDNSLYFAGDNRKLLAFDVDAGQLFTGTGQAIEHSVVVDADPPQPLEVTLVWTDVAAATGAVPAIVNDLDLIVTKPDGTQYKGNVFCGRNPGESTNGAEAQCSNVPNVFDRVNVEEEVLRLQPEIGTWTIRVEAANLVPGGQPYALVVTGSVSCPPGAQESCNGVDDDCDGLRDEGFPNFDGDGQADCIDWDDDNDGDSDASDCAPFNAAIYHGATEDPSVLATCFDGVNNDCDLLTDLDCAVDITLDAHPNGQLTVIGMVFSGSPGDLFSGPTVPEDSYEHVKEAGIGTQKKLTKIWTVQDTVSGVPYNLKVEGYRNSTAGSDNFVFSYATRASGSCTANQAWSAGILTVSKTADDDQLQTGTMGVASPVFCIRVQDSKPTNDSQVDNLFLDRVYLFPTPP